MLKIAVVFFSENWKQVILTKWGIEPRGPYRGSLISFQTWLEILYILCLYSWIGGQNENKVDDGGGQTH